ncbi:hypothetical protein [Halalkalibacter alkalisediminis]|uniref:Uncharacterized protein n=1 Tax=Halalkalibacter alkalisediminis TaxID=935616 RepID=A0ABV6NQW2_9BACI|nr:hypothetical protein [Halalkalibacter alkalisediminis]
MTGLSYQAKAGDGFKKKMLKRTDHWFNTPQEVVSEMLALKEKMDLIYENKIKWEYDGKVTGTISKMNILKGYLRGDRRTKPFYLQILSVQSDDEVRDISPLEVNKLSENDEEMSKRVVSLLKNKSNK